jgi:predicted secreted hydrolase
MGWVLRSPDDQGELIIDPRFPEQEMTMREYTNTSFWEGAIWVRGTWRGAAVNGKSYVELIGYAGDFVC